MHLVKKVYDILSNISKLKRGGKVLKRLICIILSIMLSCSMMVQAKADTDVFAGVVVDDGYKKVIFYVREKVGNEVSFDTNTNRAVFANSRKTYSAKNMLGIDKSYKAKRVFEPWYDDNGTYNEGEMGEGRLLPGVSLELKINDNIGFQLIGTTDSEGKIETYLSSGAYEYKAYKAGYKTAKGTANIPPEAGRVNEHIVLEKEEPTTEEPTTEETTTVEPTTEEPTTEESSTEESCTEESTSETESSTDNTKPTGSDATKPSDTETAKPTESATSGPGPNTGDNTPANVFMYILIAALIIILFVVIKQDKDDKEKNQSKLKR